MLGKYPVRPEEWTDFAVSSSPESLLIGDWQVMQTWERPLMQYLAQEVSQQGGSILEVGFGMGISASMILESACTKYTVIEAHPVIAENAREWARAQIDGPEIVVLEGFWQDVLPTLSERFDGILFDTYPLSEDERGKNHYSFISHTPALLNPGGVLTYYSDETTDFRSEHLEILLSTFGDIKLHTVTGLVPPDDCEYWKHDHMVIPTASSPVKTDPARYELGQISSEIDWQSSRP